MESPEALAICQQRLRVWSYKLAVEVATPVLLLGVKQGEGAGSLVLCTPQNMDTYAVRGLLMKALRELPENGSHV